MRRVHNFSAGPCTLPLEVLEETQSEFLNFAGNGMSIIEDSHRGYSYEKIQQDALASFRRLADVPDDFALLFLQGGATLQFAQTAMNLLAESETAGYVNTGVWGQKALEDASKVANIYEAWSGEDTSFTTTPNRNEIGLKEDTKWLHITSNETIGGVRFRHLPDVDIPLVADMSSDFLSRSIDWDKFDLVYGGAQKNLGPAGVSVLVIRKDLLARSRAELPELWNYEKVAKKNSMLNTPPVYAIYLVGLVAKHLSANGGAAGAWERNERKARALYGEIDASGFWDGHARPDSRSVMNVTFRSPRAELDAAFVEQASAAGMSGLKGHRLVGGLRASIYNAVPEASVEALVAFMAEFRRRNG